jgi:hypothetical protein
MKFRRYARAMKRLVEEGISRRSADTNMFVKFEKASQKKWAKADPRAIQFRSPEYCVDLARYLKPVEHRIYTLLGKGRILPRTRCIAKGLSLSKRANLLLRKWKYFHRPVALSLDVSRFDMHVHAELLEIEHMVYKLMLNDAHFAQLLSWQIKNKGKTSRRHRYCVHGRRMSGDMNTAVGNCLLMVLLVSSYMCKLGIKWDILDDGDDCLLIVEQADRRRVDGLPQYYLDCGMKLKIENETTVFEHIEWCQCRPVEYMPGKFKFVRNPFKVVSQALGGPKWYTSKRGRRKLIKSIGMAELALNSGIPVVQSYAQCLIRNAGDAGLISGQHMEKLYYRLRYEAGGLSLQGAVARPITNLARVSLAKAWGISVAEQLDLEAWFGRLELKLSGGIAVKSFNERLWRHEAYGGYDAYSLGV